jgi:hypothetical protein
MRAWHVIVATPDARFSNTTVPSVEAAVAEARTLNADYVLRTVLGEFRDAAPMTFRRDFVTLESAHLWRAKNAALVWSLEKPLEASTGNLGHYYPLLDELAGSVAKKIGRTEVAPGVLEGPSHVAIDPLRGALITLPVLGCTTDQILSMKNSGMSDEQVRRACDEQ